MLIVLAILFGAVEGLIIHYAMPHRSTRGPALAPAVGATIGGVVWLVMTWLGMSDSGWIWVASLVIPVAITWPLVALVSRLRLAHDQRERVRLKLA